MSVILPYDPSTTHKSKLGAMWRESNPGMVIHSKSSRVYEETYEDGELSVYTQSARTVFISELYTSISEQNGYMSYRNILAQNAAQYASRGYTRAHVEEFQCITTDLNVRMSEAIEGYGTIVDRKSFFGLPRKSVADNIDFQIKDNDGYISWGNVFLTYQVTYTDPYVGVDYTIQSTSEEWNDKTQSFTGSEYTAVTPGNKTLFLQTGAATTDRVKYGLTTDPTASAYSPVVMLDGKKHYIGRMTTTNTTTTQEREETYTYEKWFDSYETTTLSSTFSTMLHADSNSATLTGKYPIYVYVMTYSNIRNGIQQRYVTLNKTSNYVTTDANGGRVIAYYSTTATESRVEPNLKVSYLFYSSYTTSRNPIFWESSYWELLPQYHFVRSGWVYDGVQTSKSTITYKATEFNAKAYETKHIYSDHFYISNHFSEYSELSKDTFFRYVYDNTLWGGAWTHKSNTTHSYVNDTYTYSTSLMYFVAYYSSTFDTRNIDNITLSSTDDLVYNSWSKTARYVSDNTFTKEYFLSMISQTDIEKTYYRSAYSLTSTYTLSKKYTKLGRYGDSKASYLSGTTYYTSSAGIFSRHNAGQSSRNHVIYSARSVSGSSTIPKGNIWVANGNIAIEEVTNSLERVGDLNTVMNAAEWLYATAKVTTANNSYSVERTSTHYYTDTVDTSVTTHNINA